jgi:DNA-binding NarL/FixJ family response regulator
MKSKETLSDLPSASPPCGSKQSYRILVVDDEKAVRNLHAEVLTGAGYEVVAVADGALAWDAIQAQHFDLMITDNSMPKLSGVWQPGQAAEFRPSASMMQPRSVLNTRRSVTLLRLEKRFALR